MSDNRQDDLVSVVMIFHDAERFFDEAIRSAVTQDHPQVEVLLCDDGSTDGSTAIAQRWAAQRPDRARYLEHPGHAHRGMSATRNLGIAGARGEHVAFLDADDVWEPDHLSQMVGLLRAHPEAGLACGSALDWYSWQGQGRDDAWSPLPWPPGTVVPPPGMLVATLHRGAYSTPTCSLLVRRSLLLEVGGAEESFLGMFEDQALLAKLHLRAATVVSGARTASYRRHPESSTAVAMAVGSYHPSAPNDSMGAYLRWLAELPQVRDAPPGDELRLAVEAALEAYVPATPPPWRSRAWTAVRSLAPPGTALAVQNLATRADRRIWWGSLRRPAPLSRDFGFDRGLPVDRHYVEHFLAENAHLVQGRVLEVGDAEYTTRYGRARVTQSDVLHVDAAAPEATIVGDLADPATLPEAAFDCIVLTQTLHLVYDLAAAVQSLRRSLRPGGTLLATFPGISQVSRDQWADTWYWSLTPLAAERLFREAFEDEDEEVEVAYYGNYLATVAFLSGIAAHELRPEELAPFDPQYPLLVTVRAGRPA